MSTKRNEEEEEGGEGGTMLEIMTHRSDDEHRKCRNMTPKANIDSMHN